jgi:DNA-binding NarL/FixJ family response regulator
VSLECLLVLGGPMPTAELARIFGDVGFEVTACDSVAPAVRKLREADLKVVCIDCDLEGGVQFLTELGRHSSNRKLVAIAVCGQAFSIEEALDKGANLVLQKPVSLQTARRIVHAARSLAAGEQRFQFRLPVEIPFTAKLEGDMSAIEANIFNLAESGMGITCPRRLPVERKMSGSFVLPETDSRIQVSGVVEWSDVDGRAGVRFVGIPYAAQNTMVTWLRRQFALLPYRSRRHRAARTDG